jgi:hypothetical protein
MPLFPRVTLVLAALVGAGCSAPVVDDAADASGSMTQGVVLVERVVSGDGAPQTNVSAKFMRLSASADLELAERIVGSRLDLPAVGECTAMASGDVDEKTTSLASLGPIELIDVGDVALLIRAPADPGAALPGAPRAPAMPLAARAFPDVGDLVSGVFYTSRDAESDLPADATYALEGTGSAQAERFSIEAEAPPAPEDVRIGDAPLREGVALVPGATATVQWRPAPLSGGARGALIVIDMRDASGAVVRCAFKDEEGKATLPAAALRGRALGEPTDTASIAFHRIRRRSFYLGRPATFGATGIDTGEIRFDLSVIGRVKVAPVGP